MKGKKKHKYTQAEFDAFPVIDGVKQCPTGDYTEIEHFSESAVPSEITVPSQEQARQDEWAGTSFAKITSNPWELATWYKRATDCVNDGPCKQAECKNYADCLLKIYLVLTAKEGLKWAGTSLAKITSNPWELATWYKRTTGCVNGGPCKQAECKNYADCLLKIYLVLTEKEALNGNPEH